MEFREKNKPIHLVAKLFKQITVKVNESTLWQKQITCNTVLSQQPRSQDPFRLFLATQPKDKGKGTGSEVAFTFCAPVLHVISLAKLFKISSLAF